MITFIVQLPRSNYLAGLRVTALVHKDKREWASGVSWYTCVTTPLDIHYIKLGSLLLALMIESQFGSPKDWYKMEQKIFEKRQVNSIHFKKDQSYSKEKISLLEGL